MTLSINSMRARADVEALDAIFTTANQCHLPGIAVGVAIGDVPVYRRGFGLASMELPVNLGPTTRMRIASVTKHFTALAFMILQEQGLCSLDDAIGRHVPDLHDATRDVTVRQLMGHTSGIRDLYAITMLLHGTGRPVSDREMIAYYRTIDDRDFEPGTNWSYNNGGYVLLTAAIEQIAGEPFEEVLRKRIFEPVGMHDSLLRRWDDDFVPNSATLHMRNQSGEYTRDYMGMELTGAGGIASTVDDMLRWMKHMRSPVVGSAQTWQTMREPHRLGNGFVTGYGLGLAMGRYRGVETVSHNGGVLGGSAQMISVPALALDVIVMTNGVDASCAQLANRVIDACVEGLEAELEPGVWDAKSTLYRSPGSGRVIQLSPQGGTQTLSIDGGPFIPVAPDQAGALRFPVTMDFIRQWLCLDESGATFFDFGNADRMDAFVPCTASIGSHVGRYVCPALGASIDVRDTSDGPMLSTCGRHGQAHYLLSPLRSDIWRAETCGPFSLLGAMLTFAEDGRSLAFTAGRLNRLAFRRED